MTPASSAVAGGPDTRTVVLPGGQRLLVRPVSGQDAAALTALHASLPLHDPQRRTATMADLATSAGQAGRRAAERMATVGDRGGFGLTAAVSDHRDGPERLVGVATCELLANGDGELALVVAPGCREWLGRFLLHAVRNAAHLRRIPNLEIDVLLTDQRLLALTRTWGGALARSERPWSVRVVLGTHRPMPTWPGAHDRPRVLLETQAYGWRTDPVAIDPAWQLLVCPGPDHHPCPALDNRTCPLAAGADAIVLTPLGDDACSRALARAHPPLHPGVPVFVRDATSDGELHDLQDVPPAERPGVPPTSAVAERTVVDRAARGHAHRSDDWTGDPRVTDLIP